MGSCGANSRLEEKWLLLRYHYEVQAWFATMGRPWTCSEISEAGHDTEWRAVLVGNWCRMLEYGRRSEAAVGDRSPAIWNDLILLALRSPWLLQRCLTSVHSSGFYRRRGG